MKYRILQLKKENLKNYGFMDYEWAIKNGFKLEDYELIYESELPSNIIGKDETLLEMIFTLLNCNRPKDFKGHSLSVSDIVELEGRKYYCDGFGWKKLD